VDLSQGPAIREGWGFFRNRRPDTYQDLAVTGNVLPHDIQTPAQRGYHMPAEWEPHDAVWLAWPHNDLTFPHLAAVEETYLKIISSLQNEPISFSFQIWHIKKKSLIFSLSKDTE
jgi:agmatine deiminase